MIESIKMMEGAVNQKSPQHSFTNDLGVDNSHIHVVGPSPPFPPPPSLPLSTWLIDWFLRCIYFRALESTQQGEGPRERVRISSRLPAACRAPRWTPSQDSEITTWAESRSRLLSRLSCPAPLSTRIKVMVPKRGTQKCKRWVYPRPSERAALRVASCLCPSTSPSGDSDAPRSRARPRNFTCCLHQAASNFLSP